jgi:hypothetical protein
MDYGKKYMANADKATQQKFNDIVRDLRADMSLESAISGPPPKSGPNPQGLKVPLK